MGNIFVKTYGCSLNTADSESMQGLLEAEGHHLVNEEKDADLILINSCSVKGPTETAFFRYLDQVKGRKVVVAGCMPASYPEKLRDYSLIGTNHFDKIGEVVERTLAGEVAQHTKASLYRHDQKRLGLPKVRRNEFVDIIPISSGCLSSCTFCITKLARGILYSYAVEDIVEEAKVSLNSGVKELWLTSQDNGCYGFDRKTNLALLLRKICALPGRFMVRNGMGNPDHIMQFFPELIDAYRDEKMYKFLHLPLQSGSDKVLKEMKRDYTVADFKEIVSAFRKAFPLCTISTDIIIGYPSETDEDFMHTVSVLQEMQPEVVNISKFWPRDKTPAATLKKLDGGVVKERSQKIKKLFDSIALQRNKEWVGWTGEILINEIGKNHTLVGRNFCYKPVVVPQQGLRLGDKVAVRIVDATMNDLRGILLL